MSTLLFAGIGLVVIAAVVASVVAGVTGAGLIILDDDANGSL